jgi:hypothetical protein
MKLVDVDELKPPFDVASGMAEALIATGKVKRYAPVIPAKLPKTTWQAREGYRGQDYVESPVIVYACASCGSRGELSGPTCEEPQRLSHCNTSEAVPADVQRAFRVLRIAWDRTHKVVSGPKPSWIKGSINFQRASFDPDIAQHLLDKVR